MGYKYIMLISMIILASMHLASAQVAYDIQAVNIVDTMNDDTSDYSQTEYMASNSTVRTGRNPQTGKEIRIATGMDDSDPFIETNASIMIGDNVYYTDANIRIIELLDVTRTSEYRCGVSNDDQVVCQVTPYDDDRGVGRNDDNSLYCWGKGSIRECPNNEIVLEYESRGSGAGKVIVQDITIHNNKDSQEGEIEVLAWSWGTNERAENSNESIDIVFSVSGKTGNSSDKPAETLSLSFTKIELSYSSTNTNGQISIDMPVMRVDKDSLIFSTIELGDKAVRDDGRYCGTTSHLISIGDCDDYDDTITPESIRRNDSVPDYMDIDDDGDGIITVVNGGVGVIDSVVLSRDITRGISPRNISVEEIRKIREYLSGIEELRGRDFGLAVALSVSENERVRSLKYDEERKVVEIEHDEEMRLLGFIRVNARSKTTVHEDGTEQTRRPWWSFLATKTSESLTANAGNGVGG